MLGLAAPYGDGDVSHGGAVRGPVPVVLSGRDQDHVPLGDRDRLGIRDNLAGSLGNDQDLVSAMLVKLVARARVEANYAEVKVFAVS